MEANQFFEGEQLITQSDDKTLTLTNQRLRYNSSNYSNAHIVSIMLNNISSIEIHYKSSVLMLIIGVLLVIGGVIMGASDQGEAFVAGVGLGCLFVLFYFLTRKHVITISSDGGSKINFQTKGMKREILLDFINKIELAKSNMAQKFK